MPKGDVGTAHDPAALAEWEEAIQAEIAEIVATMTPLQARLDAAREKLDLVQRLRHLVAGAGNPNKPPNPPSSANPAGPHLEVEGHIEAILEKVGEPVHIGAIRQQLIERGVPLPGRGDEANIILRLRRAPDQFVRTGRGMYGLSRWNLQAVPPSAKKRRFRRRRKAAA
jgi:hypothetical protein